MIEISTLTLAGCLYEKVNIAHRTVKSSIAYFIYCFAVAYTYRSVQINIKNPVAVHSSSFAVLNMVLLINDTQTASH